MSEVIVTDTTTGGRKGTKLARFDLIPAEPLTQLAEHYGRGARKYEANNWRKGYSWGLSFAAMQRHAWAWRGGEDTDPETGTPHLAAVAFHAFALMEFATTHPELDDRWVEPETAVDPRTLLEQVIDQIADADAQFDFEDDAVRWIEVGDLLPVGAIGTIVYTSTETLP